MDILKRPTLLLCSLLFLSLTSTVNAKVYKWVDENGVIQYTQYPPARGESEEINTPAGPSSSAPNRDSLQNQAQSSDKRREQQKLIDEQNTALQNRQAQLAEQCANIRENLATLKSSPFIRQQQADGSMKVLTAEEHVAKGEQYQSQLDEFCKDL